MMVALMCAISAHWSLTFAQSEQTPPKTVAADSGSFTAVTVELEDQPAPAVFSVGLSAGFPSYQTVALSASLQAQFVGAQIKGSWTPAGVYLGGQLRAYPPVPVPVPLYVGIGGGVYGQSGSYHFVAGAHVPLSKALRFDLEGGVANVPQLDKRAWVPHLAAGISYAFPVELSPPTDPTTTATTAGSAPDRRAKCEAPKDPDRSQISAIIASTVDDFILSARATYGSAYTNLSYSYSISSVDITGNVAVVSVNYSGSVTEILTGTGHSASGIATVELTWNGCGWGGASVEY